jgi:ankyrin repeat protein
MTKTSDILLDESASRANPDKYGKTPLHYAAIQGSTSVAKAVAGVLTVEEISIQDKDGRTALEHAAENGDLELVEYLLELSSPISDQALQLASSKGHADIVSRLIDYGCHGFEDKALLEASKNGHSNIAMILVEGGADVMARDAASMTPLHYASVTGNSRLAQLLVREGADVDALDGQGRSPLGLASEGGHAENVKLLIQAGAKMNTIDHSGRTALDWAVEHGHSEVLRYLLRRGAPGNASRFRTDAPGPDGRPPCEMNPLQLCCKLGFESSVMVLLEESVNPDETARL